MSLSMHLLVLELGQTVSVGCTEQLYHSRLVRRQHDGVHVDPAEEAGGHIWGQVGEVQSGCGGELVICWVPVRATGSQDKPMGRDRAI